MFTSKSIAATLLYFRDTAMSGFPFIGFEYEPTLSFDRQLREEIAKKMGAYGKKYGKNKWLGAVWNKGNITYDMKRITAVNEVTSLGEPLGVHKARFVKIGLNFSLFSPSPDFLEEVEERTIVRDLGVVLPTEVGLVSGQTWSYDTNIAKFEVLQFGHLDDMTQGLICFLNLSTILDYPVLDLDSELVLAQHIDHSIYHDTAYGATLLSRTVLPEI